MTLIPDLYRKLPNRQNVVSYMSKKSCFKSPFDRQHGKEVQSQLQSRQQHCTIFPDHLEGN